MAIHGGTASGLPMRPKRRRGSELVNLVVLLALALASFLAIPPAAARESSRAPAADDWNVILGMGMLYKPDYPGSDELETQPVPYVFAEYRDLLYVHGPMLGLNVVRGERFKLGVVARYQIYADRSAEDNPALRGLDDIDAGVDAGLSARWETGPWAAELSVFQDVSDTHDGALAEFEVDREIRLGARLRAEFAATATWADDKYMQTYFGITPAQAAASGHRVYEAGSGLKSVGVSLGLNYSLDARWVLRSRLEWERLVGDAADSPLVEDAGSASQPRVGLFVGYRF